MPVWELIVMPTLLKLLFEFDKNFVEKVRKPEKEKR